MSRWGDQTVQDLGDELDTLTSGRTFDIANDRYEVVRSFGHGQTSSAVKLVRKTVGDKTELFACKAIPRKQGETARNIPLEVHILRDILPRNERLCAIVDYFPDPYGVFMMEFCDGGDLQKLANRYFKQELDIPESFLWHVFLQVAEGLAYIHQGYGQTEIPKNEWSSVIHADIKLDNLFLKWRAGANYNEDYPDIKIGDFGLSIITKERTDEAPYIYRAGTAIYQPPERPQVTFKADVWALGAVIHCLCHGKPPLESLPSKYEYNSYNCRYWSSMPWCKRVARPVTDQYSGKLQYLLNRTLEHDLLERIESDILAATLRAIVPEILEKRTPLDPQAAMPILEQRYDTPPRRDCQQECRDQLEEVDNCYRISAPPASMDPNGETW